MAEREVVVTEGGEVRYEKVFRDGWRGRQSTAAPAAELIKQPWWIDAGLLCLGELLVAGAIAVGTITVAQTQALPAVVQGTSVTAARTGATAPAPGTVVRYQDASGTTFRAVVAEVTQAEVLAQLERPEPASAGYLQVPAGRERLISALLPRLS